MMNIVRTAALGAAALLSGRAPKNNSRALTLYQGRNNGSTAPYRGYTTGINYSRPGVATLRAERAANEAAGAAGVVPQYALTGSLPRGWASQYGAVEGARGAAWNRGQGERGVVLTGPPEGYGASRTADPGLYTWGGPAAPTNAGEAEVVNNAPPARAPRAQHRNREENRYGSRRVRTGQLRGSQRTETYKLPRQWQPQRK